MLSIKQKHFHLFIAIIYGIGFIIALCIPLFSGIIEDFLSYAILGLLIFYFGRTSYKNYKAYQTTPDNIIQGGPNSDATTAEQIDFYKAQIKTTTLGTIILSLLVGVLLYFRQNLEGPLLDALNYIHSHLGFAFTMVIPLLLGTLGVRRIKNKIKRLENEK